MEGIKVKVVGMNDDMMKEEKAMEKNNVTIPTIEELARDELRDEARWGYFADYSNELLRELQLPKEKMSFRARHILEDRMKIIQSFEDDPEQEE